MNHTATIAAEQAVLGALMLTTAAVDRVAGELSPEQFGQPGHGDVLLAILALHSEGQQTDAVTVAEWLQTNGRLDEVGGLAYLVEIMSCSIGEIGLAGHVALVQQAHRRRQAQAIGQRLANLAMTDDEEPARAAAALADLETGPTSSDELDMLSAMQATYLALEAAQLSGGKLQGVTTGFGDLDAALGGWQAGDLVIIQARPAMGKTALMLAMGKAAAATGDRVGIVSAEQPAQQLTQRMLSMASGVPLRLIRSGQLESELDWASVSDAVRSVRALPIRFLDRSAPSIERVARQCRRWARSGARVVMVDYLQRLTADAPNRREEVSKIARGLKTIARDCGVCIVALAQSVRDVDGRSNQRPGLADIAESSDCEREADAVISLYRDEQARPDANDVKRGIGELILCKNRHGPTGVVEIAFDAQRVRFGELARGHVAEFRRAAR